MENETKEIKELINKHKRLQTLMYLVNKETLLMEHKRQKVNKASGVDKMTKEKYSTKKEENIEELLRKMKGFSYKPQPVRRVYIPKVGSDKLRPLGIPAYEDKLVQGVMANILNEIYEQKFYGFSYGFRPNKNCHQAIKEVNKIIIEKKINYIVDADIKGFFDNVDQKWLMKFLEHDIQDKNFLRYIVRFLKAGIMEEGEIQESEKGTPQ
ncbi:MAG TPA: group II intron reverse transcriptase/maturase, partial [Clostridiales bacterium]|nr:group II intron reverse transcriptase/maturase [Clostridiales bacterium]